MPIYEYQCLKTEEIFEIFLPISKSNQRTIVCKLHCDLDGMHSCFPHHAEKVWSKVANLQIGKPTIVFVNPKDGKAIVATSQYEKPPEGYIREELKSSIERTRFENVQNRINEQEDAIYNEGVRQDSELHRKYRTDQLKAEMSKVCSESENPSATEALMKAAINRKRKPLKKRKSEFRLDVNHLDKSNLK